MSLLKKNNPLAEYPCADYLHNALRFMHERNYLKAYDEICFAILKSGGKLSPDEIVNEWSFAIAVGDALKPKRGYPFSECPRCGGSIEVENIREYVENGKISYCNHCGQALDWSVDYDEP